MVACWCLLAFSVEFWLTSLHCFLTLDYPSWPLFSYVFGVLRHFQHYTGYITTGSVLWGEENQYIQLVKVLCCKLPTIRKKLPTFPLKVRGVTADLRGGRQVCYHCTPPPPHPDLDHVLKVTETHINWSRVKDCKFNYVYNWRRTVLLFGYYLTYKACSEYLKSCYFTYIITQMSLCQDNILS